MNEEHFDKLQRLTNFYYAEAIRCQKAKAFFAGCVMLGAVLESALLLMVECYPDEVRAYMEANRKGVPGRLSDWALVELLHVAKALKWLPASLAREEEFDSKRAQVGDYAEVVREIRNLIHPGRWAVEYPETRIRSQHLDTSFQILQATYEWLHAKLVESLQNAMQDDA